MSMLLDGARLRAAAGRRPPAPPPLERVAHHRLDVEQPGVGADGPGLRAGELHPVVVARDCGWR